MLPTCMHASMMPEVADLRGKHRASKHEGGEMLFEHADHCHLWHLWQGSGGRLSWIPKSTIQHSATACALEPM